MKCEESEKEEMEADRLKVRGGAGHRGEGFKLNPKSFLLQKILLALSLTSNSLNASEILHVNLHVESS